MMIDHGGGLYTVYMHASSLLVSPGQTVSAGDVIAKSEVPAFQPEAICISASL